MCGVKCSKTNCYHQTTRLVPIDLIFIIVFGVGFRHGYSNGIISTAFNLIAYVFGIMLAFKVTPAMTNILERLFHSQNPSMFLAAFIVNVAIIMIVLRQAAKILEGFLQALYLGIFNRVLGGVVMAALAILIYSVLLWFAVRVNFVNNTTIAESRVYPLLRDLPTRAKEVGMRFRPMAREMWDTSLTGWTNWITTAYKKPRPFLRYMRCRTMANPSNTIHRNLHPGFARPPPHRPTALKSNPAL